MLLVVSRVFFQPERVVSRGLSLPHTHLRCSISFVRSIGSPWDLGVAAAAVMAAMIAAAVLYRRASKIA